MRLESLFSKGHSGLKNLHLFENLQKTSFYFKEHLLIRKFVIQILKVLFSPPKCFCFWLGERETIIMFWVSLHFWPLQKNKEDIPPWSTPIKFFKKFKKIIFSLQFKFSEALCNFQKRNFGIEFLSNNLASVQFFLFSKIVPPYFIVSLHSSILCEEGGWGGLRLWQSNA